jgi:two-component system, sensor histidine kinase YesM
VRWGDVILGEKIRKFLKDTFKQLSNTFKVKSIQFTIALSFTFVTVLAMVFVSVTLYNKFSKAAEQNASINTRQIIDQVNTNLDYYLRSMMEISYYLNEIIYYNEDLSGNKLAESMNVILKTRKDIVTLAVVSEEGEFVAGVPSYKVKEWVNLKEQDWFKAALNKPENLYFSTPHVQNIFEGQHNWVVSLSREVTFIKNGQRVKGVLLVDMNFSAIDQLCQKVSLGKRGYIYIIDHEGNIVYHPQLQLINVGLKTENISSVLEHVFGSYYDTLNGENRLITIETVNYCRWRIVGVAYMHEIVATKQEIGSFMVWTLVLGLFVVIFISAFISAEISKPIKKLEKSMKLVKEGRFDINLNITGGDEVVQLSKAFNLMVSRIRELMEQIVHEQEEKRKSELNALQAQINPHFLYNTLDSIVWMAENGKSEDVITMVTALARLFRISISRGKNIITVGEEIEHARNYLIIQKIRYKNKFKFDIKTPDRVLQYKTLKLILQPIIENSIYHGIEYMVDEGLIKISADVIDGKLLFEVADNGLGMKPEVLKNVLLIEAKDKQGYGVGVKNVHGRIQLYYGKEYGLDIASEQEVGTIVRIWLPVVEEERLEESRHEEDSKSV